MILACKYGFIEQWRTILFSGVFDQAYDYNEEGYCR
jgi:hypothetical protein